MKKLFKDFKTFISKGNVLDLAVGVIIGSAFTAIVNSLVSDIITPVISLITGGIDLSELKWVIRPEELDAEGVAIVSELSLNYGSFIQAIINFILIAITVFIIVKVITNIQKTLDVNEKMRETIQEKLDKEQPLNKVEETWMKNMQKINPDKVPKKQEPKQEEPAQLSSTDKLLTEILSELKKENAAKSE